MRNKLKNVKQEKNNSTAIKPIKEDKSSAKIQKTKAKHNIDMTITRKQHTKIIAKHICMRCHHFWHSVATSDNIIKPCDTIKLEKNLPWRQSRVSIQYLARMWQAPIKMCTIVATIVACAQLCIPVVTEQVVRDLLENRLVSVGKVTILDHINRLISHRKKRHTYIRYWLCVLYIVYGIRHKKRHTYIRYWLCILYIVYGTRQKKYTWQRTTILTIGFNCRKMSAKIIWIFFLIKMWKTNYGIGWLYLSELLVAVVEVHGVVSGTLEL